MNYFQKAWTKIKNLFKQGLSPRQLALSISIALIVSLFPIFGISTVVLTAIALKLKINLPIMILISYIAEPLKVLLFIPFVNIGSDLFGAEHTLLTFEAIKTSYNASFVNTLQALSFELLCGIIGWAFTAVPAAVIFYLILKAILQFSVKFFKPTNSYESH